MYINLDQNPINEGERVTAAFAKACNIYYYMSDDNRASSYIKSLTGIDIINFCDILFLYILKFDITNIEKLKVTYQAFINLFDADKIPKTLKENGNLLSFEYMMAKCYDKFHNSTRLKAFMDNLKPTVRSKCIRKSKEELKMSTQIAATPVLNGKEARKVLKESKTIQTVKSKENAKDIINYFSKYTKREE